MSQPLKDVVYFIHRLNSGIYTVSFGKIKYEYEYSDEVVIGTPNNVTYYHVPKSQVFYDYNKAVRQMQILSKKEKDETDRINSSTEYELTIQDIDNVLIRWVSKCGGTIDKAKEYRNWLLSLPRVECLAVRIFDGKIMWCHEGKEALDNIWKPILSFDVEPKKTYEDDCPIGYSKKFTKSMYMGQEPANIEGKRQNWSTRYGSGTIIDGELINASFSINQNITIYIVGDSLRIVNNIKNPRYYSNKGYSSVYRSTPMEHDEIQKILDTKIRDCAFWDIVQTRAKELYYSVNMEGDNHVEENHA